MTGIPVTVKTAFMLYSPPSLAWSTSQRETAARYDWAWLKIAQEVMADASSANPSQWEGPNNYGYLSSLAADLRARNPQQRQGMYVGSFLGPRPFDPPNDWLDDTDLLHTPAGLPLVPTDAANMQYRFINYGRAQTRRKLVQKWIEFCHEYGFRGICFDGYVPTWIAGLVELPPPYGWAGLSAGCLEGPAHQAAWWAGVMQAFSLEMLYAFSKEGLEMWVNGIAPYPLDPTNPVHVWQGEGFTNVLDYNAGALGEDMYRAYLSPGIALQHLTMGVKAARKHRSVLNLAMPGLLANFGPQYATPHSDDVFDWYFHLHLLVAGPDSYFGYVPHGAYQAYSEGANPQPEMWWFSAYDRDYGVPTSEVHVDPSNPKLAWRSYTKGFCIVNLTNEWQQFYVVGNAHRWGDPVNGPLYPPGYWNIDPKRGIFLWDTGVA